ncbi:hypothetical protein E0E50_01495 [Azotobacter chroococcum subsp. isscasi]|uniref:hypothetical protein n=1 Tax=Azotobacter chroococcum TaxID=353 RepID=UPI001039703E|nr:hypothetical protein [Azotobacter chroococcum]TBW12970.1 hypothetical protein E0E50_01495 [Azotobacter chroococcum subsp. isscasi]
MSGLLRRLAAQAMGRAAPLRPMARTPYTAPPGLVEEGAEGTAPIVGEGGPIIPQDRHSGESWNRVPRQGLNQSISSNLEGVTVPLEPRSSSNLKAQALDSMDIAQHADHSDAGQAPESIWQLWPQMVPPLQTNNDDFAAAERSNGRDALQSPASLSMPDFAREPAPLLSLSDPEPPVFAGNPFAVSPSRTASLTVASDSTEVHVTIGRIEITAVHEAPPAKRSSPTKAKPMSLDEYLARRDGRRS